MITQNEITDTIILAYVNISVWTGAKRDKGLAQETAQRKGAVSDACSVTKYIVDKAMIDYVTAKAQAVRVFHYKNTVAWDDNGGRALPVARWFTYQAEISPLIDEFNLACEQFANWYSENWRNQAERLGDMFNAEEYPYPAEIRDRFKFKQSFRPIQNPDFRTQLPDTVLNAVQDSMRQGMQEGFKLATAECWKRVADVVGKVYATLEEENKIFRDTLIENVNVMVDTVGPLNIAGNSVLADALQEAKNEIGSCIPDILRVDPRQRKRVCDIAKKIYDLAVLHSQI